MENDQKRKKHDKRKTGEGGTTKSSLEQKNGVKSKKKKNAGRGNVIIWKRKQ